MEYRATCSYEPICSYRVCIILCNERLLGVCSLTATDDPSDLVTMGTLITSVTLSADVLLCTLTFFCNYATFVK